MHSESFLTTFQHIHWVTIMKNPHMRHYMWEVSKILVPAFITGVITFIAMRINDNRNKKRWLNDGHLKRKIELEIEIRKFLLGIKAIDLGEYEVLASWYDRRDDEEMDSELLCDFNKSFGKLFEYLSKENEEDSYHYKKIFALMDEYECYAPKIKNLFSDFKGIHSKIFELKTIYANEESKSQSNILNNNNVLEEVKRRPEHFDAMINTYLCFQLQVENILKKLTVKKIIK